MEVVNNNDHTGQQNQPQVNVFPTPNYSEEGHQSHEATYDSGVHDHEAFSNPNSFTTSPPPNMNDHNINNNETVVINNNNNLSHCAVCKCHCNDDENYLGSFPPGYRFVPFDDELVVHYLRRKVLGQPLPQNKIREVDLYRHGPHTLTEQYQGLGEKEWYFFTPRNRKYRNGTRPNRAAGNGYWKATGADKPINHKGIKVGSRKALVYYEGKAPDGKKTSWIMHEYRVEDPPRSARRGANDMRLDDWVLCRVYKKCDKFVKVHQREEARPEAIVSSTTTFSDEVSFLPPGMNGNGPPEPNFIGETDDHELVNNYQENVQPPFQNGFLYGISQYTDDNSLVKFAKFNNNLMMSSHHNYGGAGGGGRPVPVPVPAPIMRPPVVYSNSENTLRPLYPKEETTTAFYPKQETSWGTNVPRGYQGGIICGGGDDEGDNISNGDELILLKCHIGQLDDDQFPNACNWDSILQYMNPTTNSSQMSPEE